jgi:hypothetical protein
LPVAPQTLGEATTSVKNEDGTHNMWAEAC